MKSIGIPSSNERNPYPNGRGRRAVFAGGIWAAGGVPPVGEGWLLRHHEIYAQVLVVAALFCFVAVILLVVPAVLDRWNRWHQNRQMDQRSRAGKAADATPEIAEKVKRATGGGETIQNVLGWSDAENDQASTTDSGKVAEEKYHGTILIADDDPVVVLALSQRLRRMGYSVFRSPDAAHALMGAIKINPDLVILDVNMPSGNGLAVCEMMASDPRYASIPVIIHSVIADETTRRRAEQLGARYVEKSPRSWTEIKALIEELLKKDDSAVTRTDEKNSKSAPAAPSKTRREKTEPARMPSTKSSDDAVVPLSAVCGRPRVLCIEQIKDRMELIDHQLTGLGIEVLRTSDLEEGY